MVAPIKKETDVQQFLKFMLPDGLLAMIRSSSLTEVLSLDLQQLVPIPDVNPALLGVYNWRGEVLWLLDAGAYFGGEALYQNSLGLGKVTVVIIHSQGKTLGLCVSQVNEMVTCSLEDIQRLPRADLSPTLRMCLEGYWLDANHHVNWILSARKIIESMN